MLGTAGEEGPVSVRQVHPRRAHAAAAEGRSVGGARAGLPGPVLGAEGKVRF